MAETAASSIEEDLRRYQAGDAAGFRAFFAKSKTPIYSYLCRRLNDRAAADDVFQETYLRVHRAVLRFDPSRSAWAWLFKIAHHCLVDHRRSAARGAKLAHDYAEDGVTFSRTEEALIVRETLLQGTLGLSAEDIDIILQRFVDGDSFAELAAAKGTTEATARQRLSRALRKLKSRLPT